MYKYTLLFLLLLNIANPLQAAPKSELWPRWEAHVAENGARIDHRAWASILRIYLHAGQDGINRFKYDAVNDKDRDRLDAYVKLMSQVPISDYNRDVQRAYWINLYNALTVRQILLFYPVSSIRDISSGFFSFGPWKKKLIDIEGESLTLNDIEHRILRPIWRDPRIHYALNCAALGCPNLQLRAYTGDTTDSMLDRAAREYVNHPRGVDVVDGRLRVSSIYTWFIEDFGGNDAGVIQHIKQYAYAPLSADLQGIDRIDNDAYDWSLNAAMDTSGMKRSRDRSVS